VFVTKKQCKVDTKQIQFTWEMWLIRDVYYMKILILSTPSQHSVDVNGVIEYVVLISSYITQDISATEHD